MKYILTLFAALAVLGADVHAGGALPDVKNQSGGINCPTWWFQDGGTGGYFGSTYSGAAASWTQWIRPLENLQLDCIAGTDGSSVGIAIYDSSFNLITSDYMDSVPGGFSRIAINLTASVQYYVRVWTVTGYTGSQVNLYYQTF